MGVVRVVVQFLVVEGMDCLVVADDGCSLSLSLSLPPVMLCRAVALSR